MVTVGHRILINVRVHNAKNEMFLCLMFEFNVFNDPKLYGNNLFRKNSMIVLRTTTEQPGKQITRVKIVVVVNRFRLLETRL